MKYLLLISMFGLNGCTTPYGPQGWRGGYQDIRLGEGHYMVTAEGNGYTPKTVVMNIALKRAGELCPTGFDLISGNNDVDVTVKLNPNVFQNMINRYNTSLEIKCKDIK